MKCHNYLLNETPSIVKRLNGAGAHTVLLLGLYICKFKNIKPMEKVVNSPFCIFFHPSILGKKTKNSYKVQQNFKSDSKQMIKKSGYYFSNYF